MNLCANCIELGHCARCAAVLVSDAELKNADFIRDVRAFAFSLGVSKHHWLEFLTDLYRDYPGVIIGPNSAESLLDMDALEVPHIQDWFHAFCCKPCPPETRPRVRAEAKERVRILATVLRACYPAAAQGWGLRAANDND